MMGLLTAYLLPVMNATWLWVVVLLVSLYWLYMRTFITYYDTTIQRTDDKAFIVTGAESGIGRATVDLLAARGGRIIMACRNVDLGHTARDAIVKRTRNENIEVIHLDLTSLESVRKFAADIHNSIDRLDVLINNASIVCASDVTTSDGLNSIMQANHFGPFLLTNLLLDLLKKSSPSRIVFVSSVSHHFHKFSLANINCDTKPLPSCRVYCNSKLANILTARYLGRMLQGTEIINDCSDVGVTVNSLHPGTIQPDPAVDTCSSITGSLFNVWRNIFGKTFSQGAMTTTYVATDLKLTHTTGRHFSECEESSCVAKIADDWDLQDKVYKKSSQLVNLKPHEDHF